MTHAPRSKSDAQTPHTDVPLRLRLFISGKVKRVRFRLFVKRQADALGLAGWVRNTRSNRVEILAEGPKHDLEALLEAVKQGPPEAEVEAVDARWSGATGNRAGFRIRWIGFL